MTATMTMFPTRKSQPMTTRHKAFIFLCGSSSVGKTTLVEQFPKLVLPSASARRNGGKELEVKRTEMSFRAIREQIGNPSWEELQADHSKGMHQQTFGMQLYINRIREAFESDEDGIYLYERCPLDIVGYSTAFKLPPEYILQLQDQTVALYKELSTLYPVVMAYRKVDWSRDYDRQNNARPDGKVRHDCDNYLANIMNYFHSEAYMPPLFRIRYSVNETEQEVETLINLALQ